jgi:curved DNA-binding protein
MEYRDYYATLGVPRTASQADVKKAFRKLARKHHPDVNKTDPSAEARFKEANEAYAVLGEPDKRKAYDAMGPDWAAYQSAGAGAGAAGRAGGRRGFAGSSGAGSGAFPGGMRFEFGGDAGDLAGFSDFFRTFFASGAGGPGGAGSAMGGTESGVRYGGGANGQGAVGASGTRGRRGPGTAARRDDLHGDVEVTLQEVAAGTQRLVQIGERRLEVSIPPGVASGHRIRLSGKAGEGPAAGHVYLTVTVLPHPVFSRDGANLSRELPVSLGEALLGAEVPVATLDDRRLLLRIPAGTQTGRVIRLAGQGLPRFRAEGRGDLFVRVRVVLPAGLDDEGRGLAQQLIDHIAQPNPRDSRDSREPAARST